LHNRDDDDDDNLSDFMRFCAELQNDQSSKLIACSQLQRGSKMFHNKNRPKGKVFQSFWRKLV